MVYDHSLMCQNTGMNLIVIWWLQNTYPISRLDAGAWCPRCLMPATFLVVLMFCCLPSWSSTAWCNFPWLLVPLRPGTNWSWSDVTGCICGAFRWSDPVGVCVPEETWLGCCADSSACGARFLIWNVLVWVYPARDSAGLYAGALCSSILLRCISLNMLWFIKNWLHICYFLTILFCV